MRSLYDRHRVWPIIDILSAVQCLSTLLWNSAATALGTLMMNHSLQNYIVYLVCYRVSNNAQHITKQFIYMDVV